MAGSYTGVDMLSGRLVVDDHVQCDIVCVVARQRNETVR